MKKKNDTRQCDICGKDLELLEKIDSLCQQDVELKVLIYRKFLRVPLRSVIVEPLSFYYRQKFLAADRFLGTTQTPFRSGGIVVSNNSMYVGALGSLSPIFNKPSYLG